MTKYGVILAIMDMASAKSDVNGPKKKACFWRILIIKKEDKNSKTKKVLKRKNQNCIEFYLSFIKFKNGFCHIKSHLNLKSYLLTLYFFSFAECTIHTKHLVPYTHKNAPKTYTPNCIKINISFHN